jgi:signal transduction histidine kinase
LRELSLHILDLIENSVRAGASVVFIDVTADSTADLLHICVEDNGPGFGVPVETAFDPFYTTKEGKKMGLGLSLFRGAAQRASGEVWAGRSDMLGGAAIRATMRLTHVDRSPLGDLGGTLAGMVCTNPEIDFRISLHLEGRQHFLSSAQIFEESGYDSLEAAEKVNESILGAMQDMRDL